MRCACSNRLHLGDALLRRRQIKEGARRRQQLLHLRVFQIGLRRTGATLRRLGAQGPLVAALIGPVNADAFVNALVPQQAPCANAVLQVDGTELGRQRGEWRMVRRQHIGLCSGGGAARQCHVNIVARGPERLRECYGGRLRECQWRCLRARHWQSLGGLCMQQRRKRGACQSKRHSADMSYPHD